MNMVVKTGPYDFCNAGNVHRIAELHTFILGNVREFAKFWMNK